MEVGHRLSETPGKCLQIHGHSMWVEMEIWGEVDAHGLMQGVEYGDMKKVFRHYMDTEFDHHTLLNRKDPFVLACAKAEIEIPGLALCAGDPTTENLARWIGEWGVDQFDGLKIPQLRVRVHETSVNLATWTWQG